jgi:tetratricopeptide (TPR) repeat protein
LPLLLLCACTSAPPLDDNTLPPSSARQSELTALFDRVGGEEKAARSAAAQAAKLDDRDMRFFSSLWGTRSSAPVLAWRLADALSANALHQHAFAWYQRAFSATPAHDPQRAWLRYEMAEECLALGKPQDAINLLSNRLDPSPLPDDLRARYEALLEAAAKASR